VKSAILKNEMKYDRCANAYDCYMKLTRDLTKNGEEDVNQNWLKWERKLDHKILQKTALKTNRTFIGLGTEHTEEYQRLTSAGNQHIIYTDRKSIPDMAPIVGTQSLYQLQGDRKKVSAGLWNLHTALLPCSCPPCRFNPSNRTTCVYKDSRDLKTNIVSLKSMNDDNDDLNGVNNLSVEQLKQELRTRGLKLNGNKPDLIARLVHHLENEEACDDDEIHESVAIDSSSDLTTTRNPSATVINGGTADTTVVNGGATSTSGSDSITPFNIINGGATSSSSDLTTTRNPSATVINGGTADAAVPIYTCVGVRSLTVVQIKEQLRARGLRLGGNKALLKERLIGAIVHCNAIAGGGLGSSTIEINDRATN